MGDDGVVFFESDVTKAELYGSCVTLFGFLRVFTYTEKVEECNESKVADCLLLGSGRGV